MYYLRTRPAYNPIQFTVNKKQLARSRALNQDNTSPINATSTNGNKTNDAAAEINATVNEPQLDLEHQMAAMICSLNNKDECMMCGS